MSIITYESIDVPESWSKDRLRQEIRTRLGIEQKQQQRIAELEAQLAEARAENKRLRDALIEIDDHHYVGNLAKQALKEVQCE